MSELSDLLSEISALPTTKGISAADVLLLPDRIGRLFKILIRSGTMGISDISNELGFSQQETLQIVKPLIMKGYLEAVPPPGSTELTYRVSMVRMRPRAIPLDL